MHTILTFDISDQPLIEFTGPDRAKSLHNLTTQEIKGLPSGQVTEAFVTSPQGKTLGFFTIRNSGDALTLGCEPGGEQLALVHFAKYTMFDDVRFEVVTEKHEQRLWLGDEALRAFQEFFDASGSDGAGRCVTIERPGIGRVELIRTDAFAVPAIRIITGVGHSSQFEDEIAAAAGLKLTRGDASQFERIRVLSALPRFPVEIRADNLPQEIDRDETAINFRKGCYLGQETVARLDALGHVNRILRCFVFDSDHVPIEPAQLIGRSLIDEAGQQVGEIRSAVEGEHPNQAVGMALIRVKALEGVVKVVDSNDANLTISKPAEFRENFAPLVTAISAVR
jgi:folate-binding protein YgfZ